MKQIQENTRLTRLVIFVFLILSASIPEIEAQEAAEPDGIDMALHVRLQEMRSAEPPRIYGDSILFTYTAARYYESRVRSAGIAFAHESYRSIHRFRKIIDTGKEDGPEQTGVLFLLYPLPRGIEKLEYRLIIDGIWMTDPSSDDRELKESGLEVSVFRIPHMDYRAFRSPETGPDQRVTFRFRGNPGQRLYLSGSFNDWDPFMYRMAEQPDMPGLYTLTLRLPEGVHYYAFIRNGETITDPLNNRLAERRSGMRVSVLEIGSPPIAQR
jgi:hypothetical protein